MKPGQRHGGIWAAGLLAAIFLLTAQFAWAGYKPGPGWAEVSTPLFQALSPVDATARIEAWRLGPEHVVRPYRDSGSMRPLLIGPGIMLAMEACRPSTPLRPGMLVQFDRGDYAAILHYVAAVSADGQSVYMSGIHNRRSDGWYDRGRVAFVVREVIKPPRIPAAIVAAK